MNSTIPDEKEDALREEKADLIEKIKPTMRVLESLDKARNKYLTKLMDLRACYHMADRELAEATKVTKVDKKSKAQDGTAALASILSDPKKAAKLMAMLEEDTG